jgi:hypothetical protein
MCAGLACSKPKVKILMLDDDGAVLLVAKVQVPHLDYFHDDNRDAASCVVVYHVCLLTCLFARGERERRVAAAALTRVGGPACLCYCCCCCCRRRRCCYCYCRRYCYRHSHSIRRQRNKTVYAPAPCEWIESLDLGTRWPWLPCAVEAVRLGAATPSLRSAGTGTGAGTGIEMPATTAGSREMCMASQQSPSCPPL